MFVSTRAFSATGMYPIQGYSWELRMPEGLQIVDGADNIRRAVREQVKFASGTDADGFAWTEIAAKEFAYMLRNETSPPQAIQSSTTVAAELPEQQVNIGAIERGRFADIIAVAGDPLRDVSELERVKFVMKNGRVVRNDFGR